MNVQNILGIRIDNLSRDEIGERVRETLAGPPRQKFVTTLNPEIILEGHRDKSYAEILNSADLNLCDGFGIKFASWLRGKAIKARYTGVDLTDFLLKLAREKKQDVLVVMREDSLSKPLEIERAAEKKYGLKISARYWDGERFFEDEKTSRARIVFVNFGAPRQEKFLKENRAKFPEARILAGVGGTFDFLTGKMKRAPRWMRKMGLEWLWRFIQEPKRAKRIWNATVAFPFAVLANSENK